MSTIMPFDFEGRAIRVVEDDAGVPWFVARDVCDALELKNSRQVVDRLDEDEKGVHIVDTLGGSQEVSTVNEPGLYNLTLTSRKPEAKRFKRWITHDVLPAIRKTGRYEAEAAAADPVVPALLAQPQHRADQLVSAGRIFSAALRTARNLRMPPGRAMRAAFACAQRHTGIDWADELDAGDIAADAERTGGEPDTLRQRLTEHLAGIDSFEMATLITELNLEADYGAGVMKRIAAVARDLGWRPHRWRGATGGWHTTWRAFRLR